MLLELIINSKLLITIHYSSLLRRSWEAEAEPIYQLAAELARAAYGLQPSDGLQTKICSNLTLTLFNYTETSASDVRSSGSLRFSLAASEGLPAPPG